MDQSQHQATLSEPNGNLKPEQSQANSEKAQVKSLLAEARNTRDMLVDFRAAVESGTYAGSRMLAVAKGYSFLEAILNQNQAHIKNLQERMDS